MRDVPHSSLLDRRIPFTGRQALPETSGVYAWWVRDDITRADANPDGASLRPLYLGAAKDIAASVAADATGVKATALRVGLATLMAERLGCAREQQRSSARSTRANTHQPISLWISANLLVSWSELSHPFPYRDALARALDPQLKP